MNIVLHCGGMAFNGTTIEHSSLGGSETSAYYLAINLAKLGHRVTLFTNCNKEDEGVFDGVSYVSSGKVSEETPLGNVFHAYAINTPHDVCIVQRSPYAFRYNWASKINIWWLHDLATIHRSDEAVKHLWNVDKIWCVSEYHKNQVCDTWNINEDIIDVVHNGVDDALVNKANDIDVAEMVPLPVDYIDNKKLLIYSSRPERGLEHLVAPNGIMERLGEEYQLLVCSYSNTLPSTKDYYEYLDARCFELPNVQLLGHLTKEQLYAVMSICDVHVYPTEFEEVSCITAMEDMACSLPMLTTKHGALPETCKGAGVKFIKLPGKNEPRKNIVEDFVHTLKKFDFSNLKIKQFNSSSKYYWSNVIHGYCDSINVTLSVGVTQESLITHFVEHSDIITLKKYISDIVLSDYSLSVVNKTLPLYKFANSPERMAKHYESYYEKSNLLKEDLSNNNRYSYISGLLGGLPDGSTVLDYGCGHGHYTINLAKKYPNINFISVDVSKRNIKFSKEWSKEEGLTNTEFYCEDITRTEGSEFWKKLHTTLDAVICLEVVEHVVDYKQLVAALSNLLKTNGVFIASTPYGRWEWQSFEEYGDYRFHLHHFEYKDIKDIITGCNNNYIATIPSGVDNKGLPLGSYVWSFRNLQSNCINEVDYSRKIANTKPRQLCSLNMIVKDCEDTVIKSIKSAIPLVDEIIIGVDESSTHTTYNVIKHKLRALQIPHKLFYISSPLKTGFDKSRNTLLSETSLDWVLWLDADEVIYSDYNSTMLLRNNEFNGYAIKQHHYSVEPAGILKTDLPLRLFRTNRGIKFNGYIHEHPEIKVNDGAGYAQLIDSITICHYGYDNHDTRRKRFERNIDLMIKDRELNPKRNLGKMLWVRDLQMMNQYELEHNGMRVTKDIVARCKEVIRLWRELVNNKHTRLVLESLQYYSACVELLNDGEFEMSFAIGSSKSKGNSNLNNTITSLFETKEDAENLISLLFNESYKEYDSKYYY